MDCGKKSLKLMVNYSSVIFRLILIFITFLPITLVALSSQLKEISIITSAIILIMSIGGAHVPSTAFLLYDKEIRRYFLSFPITMIVIPIITIIITINQYLAQRLFE